MDELKTSKMVEQHWVVDGVRLAGIVSGPAQGVPVLALHGWLDNASSFNELRNHLPEFRFVAIDLPGHGLSGHRSPDSGYQIWDDLPQLVGLIEQLGWDRFIVLGHSRGAMISALLAAVMGEKVAGLITLDGLVPLPANQEKTIDQMRSFFKDRERLVKKPPRVFNSVEDYVDRRARSGEPKLVAEQLATRNLTKLEEGYQWRGDFRLSGASLVKMSSEQIVAMLSSLSMPVLNVWATPSERMRVFSQAAKDAAQDHIANLTTVEIAGHHHWHMEKETGIEIAAAIEAFTKNVMVSSNV